MLRGHACAGGAARFQLLQLRELGSQLGLLGQNSGRFGAGVRRGWCCCCCTGVGCRIFPAPLALRPLLWHIVLAGGGIPGPFGLVRCRHLAEFRQHTCASATPGLVQSPALLPVRRCDRTCSRVNATRDAPFKAPATSRLTPARPGPTGIGPDSLLRPPKVRGPDRDVSQ